MKLLPLPTDTFQDPLNDDSKTRAINFWYTNCDLLKALQKQGTLDLKNPIEGVKNYYKNVWAKFEYVSSIQSSTLKNGQNISNLDQTKQKIEQLNLDTVKEQIKICLMNFYLYDDLIESFVTIIKTWNQKHAEQKMYPEDVFEIIKTSCSIEPGEKAKTNIRKAIQSRKPIVEKQIKAAKEHFSPNNVITQPSKSGLLKEVGEKKVHAIKTGEHKLITNAERCVTDWYITKRDQSGNLEATKEHEFKRCKPHDHVRYEEENKYGWANKEFDRDRYRQDSVFGVPVVFKQGMEFMQDDNDTAKLKKFTIYICSKIYGSFYWKETGIWYIDPVTLRLGVTEKQTINVYQNESDNYSNSDGMIIEGGDTLNVKTPVLK